MMRVVVDILSPPSGHSRTDPERRAAQFVGLRSRPSRIASPDETVRPEVGAAGHALADEL